MDCGDELDRCAGEYAGVCGMGVEDEGPFGALGTNWEGM